MVRYVRESRGQLPSRADACVVMTSRMLMTVDRQIGIQNNGREPLGRHLVLEFHDQRPNWGGCQLTSVSFSQTRIGINTFLPTAQNWQHETRFRSLPSHYRRCILQEQLGFQWLRRRHHYEQPVSRSDHFRQTEAPHDLRYGQPNWWRYWSRYQQPR